MKSCPISYESDCDPLAPSVHIVDPFSSSLILFPLRLRYSGRLSLLTLSWRANPVIVTDVLILIKSHQPDTHQMDSYDPQSVPYLIHHQLVVVL
jgi:hypothetical protein